MRISLEQALNILMDHVTHGKTERKNNHFKIRLYEASDYLY